MKNANLSRETVVILSGKVSSAPTTVQDLVLLARSLHGASHIITVIVRNIILDQAWHCHTYLCTLIYDWSYENGVNNLRQITHMHFDFPTPKSYAKEKKIVGKKG